MLEEPDDLGELTCDAITGTFRITQRKRGHRYSIDDVMTAWEAANAAPHAARCLELGTGIGSVLLMLAYKLPAARFVAVEAQRNSFALATRNVADNQLAERVELIHCDLREDRDLGSFDLVTGTPPYVPKGTATPSSDVQKAYCRQELRGGVEAYLEAMGRTLAPHGVGVVCADARFPERAFRGAEQAGLAVVRQRDVLPRAGSKPLFAVFTVVRSGAFDARFEHSEPWVARDEAGARTRAYHEVRSFFGIDPPAHEAPSP